MELFGGAHLRHELFLARLELGVDVIRDEALMGGTGGGASSDVFDGDTVRCESIAGNFRELSGVYRLEPTTEGVRFLYSGRLVPALALMTNSFTSGAPLGPGIIRSVTGTSARRGGAGRGRKPKCRRAGPQPAR